MEHSMIERVARAIEDTLTSRSNDYPDLARAAITAMREPNAAMTDAANEAMDKHGVDIDLAYQAMIDAALKEAVHEGH